MKSGKAIADQLCKLNSVRLREIHPRNLVQIDASIVYEVTNDIVLLESNGAAIVYFERLHWVHFGYPF